MSTHAYIKITEWQGNGKDSKPVVTLFKHFDGYPKHLGSVLHHFLTDTRLVNGIPFGKPEEPEVRYFNGIGCLAAQLVSHLKTMDGKGVRPGDVYIGDGGIDAEYTYHIKACPTDNEHFRDKAPDAEDFLHGLNGHYANGNIQVIVEDRKGIKEFLIDVLSLRVPGHPAHWKGQEWEGQEDSKVGGKANG